MINANAAPAYNIVTRKQQCRRKLSSAGIVWGALFSPVVCRKLTPMAPPLSRSLGPRKISSAGASIPVNF